MTTLTGLCYCPQSQLEAANYISHCRQQSLFQWLQRNRMESLSPDQMYDKFNTFVIVLWILAHKEGWQKLVNIKMAWLLH